MENNKIANHLDNVLAAVTDRKLPHQSTGVAQSFSTDFSDGNYSSIFTNDINYLLDNTQNYPEGNPGKSLKVTQTVPSQGFVNTNLISVQRGDNVDFSVQMKYLSGPWSGSYIFALVDASLNRMTQDGVNYEWQFPYVTTPNQWEKAQMNYQVPETLYQLGSSTPYTGQVYIWAFPWLSNSTDPDTWFDDLSIKVTPTWYTADVVSATDYYPFGSIMPDRNFNTNIYRHGFNGKEKDEEVKGNGNSLDFGARMYDPRLGRFITTDPAKSAFSFESPYVFAGNTPIWAVDVNGEKIYYIGMNMEAVDARRTLLRAPHGKFILDYYEKNNTHDIYISIGDFASTDEAGARTLTHVEKYVDINGKLDLPEYSSNNKEDNKFRDIFQGIDVSQSKGKGISIIGLNKEVFTYKDKNTYDPYWLASLISHEIYAHIFYGYKNNENEEHKEYGQYSTAGDLIKDYDKNQMLFQRGTTVAQDVLKELYKLKMSDIKWKQNMDKIQESFRSNSKITSQGKGPIKGAIYGYMLKGKK